MRDCSQLKSDLMPDLVKREMTEDDQMAVLYLLY